MKKPNDIIKILFKALVATIFIGATFHLVLIAIIATRRANPSYINPIDFLGIGYVYPGLQSNRTAAIITWSVIFIIYLAVLYLVIHYHRYLGIVQNTKSYKVATHAAKKMSQKKPKIESKDDSEI